MKIEKTSFDDLLIINHNIFADVRGEFREIFKTKILDSLKRKIVFCQENSVISNFMVLRGLHFQLEPHAQTKLISVIKGEIFDVAVDIRKNSKTYGKYFQYKLSEKSKQSILIPKGFAHGYLTLSKTAYVNYKVDNYYNKESERGINYNDKQLNIDWGVDHQSLIISEKDKGLDDFTW